MIPEHPMEMVASELEAERRQKTTPRDREAESRKAEADLAHQVEQRERRERIATAVLAGLAAGRDYDEIVDSAKSLHGKAAPMAVAWADALIAELDK